MKKKYVCKVCGAEVEVEEGESCPVCGVGFEYLQPVEEESK